MTESRELNGELAIQLVAERNEVRNLRAIIAGFLRAVDTDIARSGGGSEGEDEDIDFDALVLRARAAVARGSTHEPR